MKRRNKLISLIIEVCLLIMLVYLMSNVTVGIFSLTKYVGWKITFKLLLLFHASWVILAITYSLVGVFVEDLLEYMRERSEK